MRPHYLPLLRLHPLLLCKPGKSLRKRTPMDLIGNRLPTVGQHNRTIAPRNRLHRFNQCASNKPAPVTIPK